MWESGVQHYWSDDSNFGKIWGFTNLPILGFEKILGFANLFRLGFENPLGFNNLFLIRFRRFLGFSNLIWVIGFRWVPGNDKFSGYEDIYKVQYFWLGWVPGYRPENFSSGRWVPARRKILSTDGYRVPARKKFWVPMGTGFRENFHLCRPLDTTLMIKT